MSVNVSDGVQAGVYSAANAGAVVWTTMDWVQNSLVLSTLLLNLAIACLTGAMAFSKFKDMLKDRNKDEK